MAQWEKMKKIMGILSSETFAGLYPSDVFPIEARHFIADWIESQRWEEFYPERMDQEGMARELLTQFLCRLETAAEHLTIVDKMKLRQVQNMVARFNNQALSFVIMVRDTLRQERIHISSVDPSLFTPDNFQNQDLINLDKRVNEISQIRQQIHHHREELNLERHTYENNIGNHLPQQQHLQNFKAKVEFLEHKLCILIGNRMEILGECVTSLECCQNKYLELLKTWKWQQHRAVVGFNFDPDLQPLQARCEHLHVINERLRQEMMLVGEEAQGELLRRLEWLMKCLYESSLVVEKQPPQVIKTQSKFSTTVRCLLGEKVSGVKPVVLKAQIVNELQARSLGNAYSNDTVGELINNQSVLESNSSNRTTCATFRNMSVKKIKRADRKGCESVTEEKFALLFTTNLIIPGCDTPYMIQMISQPVVVIVHGSQDSNAVATILWDCAFAREDRIPFAVPDAVSWREMFNSLNAKFVSEVNTNQNLQQLNQVFLAQKIFDQPDIVDFAESMVSWAQFNKEVLPTRTFTFWQWFEGVIDLTKKHLRPYWGEGLILGFIDKKYTSILLNERPVGTFLLRFSDSEIGGITIAYVGQNSSGIKIIQNIQPFLRRDLEIRNLADRIRDIGELIYAFPDKHKDAAFEKHYTVSQALPSDGYLPIDLKTEVKKGQCTTLPAPMPLPIHSALQYPQEHLPSLEMSTNSIFPDDMFIPTDFDMNI